MYFIYLNLTVSLLRDSAYYHFYDATRPRLMAEHPDSTLAEMTKLVSAEWKDISDEERKVYKAMAEPDKERYARDLLRMKQSRDVVAPDLVGSALVGRTAGGGRSKRSVGRRARKAQEATGGDSATTVIVSAGADVIGSQLISASSTDDCEALSYAHGWDDGVEDDTATDRPEHCPGGLDLCTACGDFPPPSSSGRPNAVTPIDDLRIFDSLFDSEAGEDMLYGRGGNQQNKQHLVAVGCGGVRDDPLVPWQKNSSGDRGETTIGIGPMDAALGLLDDTLFETPSPSRCVLSPTKAASSSTAAKAILFDPASIFQSPPPEPNATGYRADDDPPGCWAELPDFEMRNDGGRIDDDGGLLLSSFDNEPELDADDRGTGPIGPYPAAALPQIDCEEDLGEFAQLFLAADA